MKQFKDLPKLNKGDKVAILSPSLAAPGLWPHVYERAIRNLKKEFDLVPVEYPATKKLGASKGERSKDLIDAFKDKEIKAVIASLGGNDQVTYIKNLPQDVFIDNPKPFFGNSDNTHFCNHLWLSGIPSYYGGTLMDLYAKEEVMNPYTVKYLKYAFFEKGEFEIEPSLEFNDREYEVDWNNPETMDNKRTYDKGEGWFWDGNINTRGISWGGCLESIDELLRHGIQIPSLEDFKDIVLFLETSEEKPTSEYVERVFRALGERGILSNIKALIVGRPAASSRQRPNTLEERMEYKRKQRETILNIVRVYNKDVPIIQNFDIGHTVPQVCLPMGKMIRIDSDNRKIFAEF